MAFRMGRLLLVICTLFSGQGWAGAGPASGGIVSGPSSISSDLESGVSLAALITEAGARNPSIEAARAAWKARIENVRIDSALPDPRFQITWYPAPIETRLGPQDWNVMLSQQIPFPKKLSTKKDIAVIEAEVARLRTRKIFREIVAEVKAAFYELAYIRAARDIAARNLDLLNRFTAVSESAYAQDRGIFADVVKSQSQAGQVRYDLMLLEDLEQTQITALNGLLNREPRAGIGPLIGGMEFPELPDIELFFRTAKEQQEGIAMAREMVKKAQRSSDLAKYLAYPDLRLGVTWSVIGRPDVSSPPKDAGDDAFGIQFGVSIPLWSGKNRGQKLAALSVVKEKEADRQKIVNRTLTDIRAIYYKTRNAYRQTALYEKDLLPQALRALAVSETWFREGEGPFSDVLESRASVYNFQLSLARARADIGKNIARLERLVGASFSEIDTGEAVK